MHRAAILILAAGTAILASPPTYAADTEVSIAKRDCQRLVRHRAQADVAFTPGVDVRGRKVAPANVDDANTAIRLPNQLTIDIGVDLAKRFGTGGGGTQFSSNVSIGKVKFDRRTGQITFNDQPIGNSTSNAIAQKCQEMLSKGR